MLQLPDFNPSLEQQSAVDLCCDRTQRIVAVTGGAGTGKSTTLRRVYDELLRDYSRADIVLAAPTGRAAKRITEVTGIKAVTLHRLLEFPDPGEDTDEPNEPQRNASNPLVQRVIIVDEASMIGPTLYRQLLDATRGHTLLRFFGDNNQLAPVEKGEPPFLSMVEKRPTVWLTYNYRSGDALIANGLRVLEGRVPLRNDRFEIIYSEDPIAYLNRFVEGAPEFANLDHQIIVPTRNGKYGTERLNPSLQLRLNPDRTSPLMRLPRYEEDKAELAVRAGDKFLWIKNDYHFGLFNGEIGHIIDADPEDGVCVIHTEGREITIPARVREYSPYFGHTIIKDPRKAIELGYAITTHKAQGSEFDTIIYLIMRGHAWLLNRRNFYTAITRARNRVIVIAEQSAMRYALKPERER